MKDFFDTWKFKILVAVAVFLVGIMAYAGANGRLTAAPQELLGVILTPFRRRRLWSAAVWARCGKNTPASTRSWSRTSSWRRKTPSCASRWWTTTASRLRIKHTRRWLTFRKRQQCHLCVRLCIGRDPLDSFWGFTLDRGTLDGVAVNDAVISDEGYLLGVVREADLTSCKIMTILHPSFNAAGVVSRTRDNGIITGSADYAADGLCILSNLARSTLSREGDQVITTGLGGVFPPDVLVGVIKELTPEASGKSTLAVIQPGADPRTVRHVFIITNY